MISIVTGGSISRRLRSSGKTLSWAASRSVINFSCAARSVGQSIVGIAAGPELGTAVSVEDDEATGGREPGADDVAGTVGGGPGGTDAAGSTVDPTAGATPRPLVPVP